MSIIKDNDKLEMSLDNHSVQVYFYGATVTSYKVKGQELLFISKTAALDGSKAIRGGIPIVFPQFGTSIYAETLKQHGFARIHRWNLKQEHLTNDSVAVELGNIAY